MGIREAREAYAALAFQDFEAYQKRRDAVGNIDPSYEPHRQLLGAKPKTNYAYNATDDKPAKQNAAHGNPKPWSEYTQTTQEPPLQQFYRGNPVERLAASYESKTPDAPKRLPSALADLNVAKMRLAGLVESVVQRLRPVLCPEPPVNCSAGADNSDTGIEAVDTIADTTWELNSIARRLEDVLIRLEV